MISYWHPRAYDDFANDLRYQHGFIQLQDMIDRAIIKLHSSQDVVDKFPQVYHQQFPNPCFNKDAYVITICLLCLKYEYRETCDVHRWPTDPNVNIENIL